MVDDGVGGGEGGCEYVLPPPPRPIPPSYQDSFSFVSKLKVFNVLMDFVFDLQTWFYISHLFERYNQKNRLNGLLKCLLPL